MNKRSINYVYEIHIATTSEKLWSALTSTEALKQNWGKIESQWKEGSKVTEVAESGKVLWQGEVLRSEPPHLLSYTMDVNGIEESPTEVTFQLGSPVTEVAPDARVVRLTLTQSGFEENSKLFAGCSRAWPEILSSFKSYLETGRPIRFLWTH